MATVYLLNAGAGRTRPSTAAWGQGTLKEAVFCSALSLSRSVSGGGQKMPLRAGQKLALVFPAYRSQREAGREQMYSVCREWAIISCLHCRISKHKLYNRLFRVDRKEDDYCCRSCGFPPAHLKESFLTFLEEEHGLSLIYTLHISSHKAIYSC